MCKSPSHISGESIYGLQFCCYSGQLLADLIISRHDGFAVRSVEIVKAALFTPASAKIPAPQINLGAIPGPQPTNKFGSAVPPVSAATPTAAQTFGVRGQQGLPAQQSYVRPPRPSNPGPGIQSQPNVSGQGMLVGSTIAASRPPCSTDLLAGRNGGSQAGTSSQAPNTSVSSRSQDAFGLAVSTPSAQQTQQEIISSVRPDLSKSDHATLSHGNLPDAKVPKTVSVAGNGFPSDSLFGDPVHQHQQAHLTVRSNQQVPVQSSAANPSAARNYVPGQSQLPWPRITQSDYPKYSKVFMAVDTDMDGKITGTEARSLFLSWKLPQGLQQTQGPSGARQAASGAPRKPPRPVPIPQLDEAVQPTKQKPKVPELEKHLIDQLSTEEQDSMNRKFQEATDAEKVMELEKEILDAKEKNQFYHAKMQEIEKKMELYRTIVKMDQDGKTDGIQDRANQIQADLEGLVKSLNERCKTYGLWAKPTTLLELPFWYLC
ncbi:hypothetical protein K7X08_033866 [Anisodus acutangulus]|uniref:EF-hand domain-containing protein n=1 Tax=Anisodus acutangulus TaxID=402998 RepID=A0A9Q1M7H3_9SOLA|nr:hypothetical protein K7X08_033866 [Anisodus acutangulus]